MSDAGHCRIFRCLIGHHAFRNDAESMAFAWLVLMASWRPVRVRYKGKSISLKRGQLSVSQRDMAKALDRDKAWVERLLKRLKSEAMIEAINEAGTTVITICKYEQYQQSKPGREAPEKAGARQTQGTEQGTEGIKEVSSGSKNLHVPLTEVLGLILTGGQPEQT